MLKKQRESSSRIGHAQAILMANRKDLRQACSENDSESVEKLVSTWQSCDENQVALGINEAVLHDSVDVLIYWVNFLGQQRRLDLLVFNADGIPLMVKLVSSDIYLLAMQAYYKVHLQAGETEKFAREAAMQLCQITPFSGVLSGYTHITPFQLALVEGAHSILNYLTEVAAAELHTSFQSASADAHNCLSDFLLLEGSAQTMSLALISSATLIIKQGIFSDSLALDLKSVALQHSVFFNPPAWNQTEWANRLQHLRHLAHYILLECLIKTRTVTTEYVAQIIELFQKFMQCQHVHAFLTVLKTALNEPGELQGNLLASALERPVASNFFISALSIDQRRCRSNGLKDLVAYDITPACLQRGIIRLIGIQCHPSYQKAYELFQTDRDDLASALKCVLNRATRKYMQDICFMEKIRKKELQRAMEVWQVVVSTDSAKVILQEVVELFPTQTVNIKENAYHYQVAVAIEQDPVLNKYFKIADELGHPLFKMKFLNTMYNILRPYAYTPLSLKPFWASASTAPTPVTFTQNSRRANF